MEVWAPDTRLDYGFEVWVLGWTSGPELKVWDPDVCLSPGWRSGPLIQDWILGLRSEPRDGLLDRDMNVWDTDVGLSPRLRSRSWDGGLGPDSRLDFGFEILVPGWTSEPCLKVWNLDISLNPRL